MVLGNTSISVNNYNSEVSSSNQLVSESNGSSVDNAEGPVAGHFTPECSTLEEKKCQYSDNTDEIKLFASSTSTCYYIKASIDEMTVNFLFDTVLHILY